MTEGIRTMNVVCLNDKCPEYHRGKSNPSGLDPAGIVCGTCEQPINVATSVPVPSRVKDPS